MTDYKTLKGKRVKTFATDLDNEQAEGQIFFSTASPSREFKTVVAGEAWSSSSPINFNRAYIAGFGTQTAALGCGGYNTPPATFETATEEYNGSGWSTGGALNTGRWGLRGAGSQTAGLVFMGIIPGSPNRTAATEEYDGSSWTNGGSLSQLRYQGGAAGTQTAGLGFGGGIAPGPTNFTTNTEEYNGTSWTAGGALNTVTRDNGSASAAPQTAALSFGGSNGSINAQSEEYDGSSWTVVNSMNTARVVMGGSGVQTDALAYGGTTPPDSAATESYNGTSWSTSPATLATARRYLAGAGSNGSAAVAFQGKSGSTNTTLTEEYHVTVNTITAGAWSAGGTIPYSAISKNGSGILTAAFVVGGETPPGAMVNTSASYNGTSWTATNNINSARGNVQAAGTLTAGLIMGGYQNVPDPNFLFEETEEYNGTSWSEVNDMPTGGYSGSGTGTQTAAFVNNLYIGSPGERTNITYEYDGTNWSNGGNTAETTNSRASVGTLTAGLTVGGRPAPSTYIDETELYDGTSWTAGVDMISEFQNGGQSSKGTQTDCIIFGSPRSPSNTDAFKTDGTTWFTQPSLASSQNEGTGTSTAALAFGNNNDIQEFAGETTSLNLKTITDS